VVGKSGEDKAQYYINSYGWNAIRDYTEQRDQATTRIAVIGDSYVEALNVPLVAAMASVLERALLQTGRRIEVYSFGISTASASHYLAMMRYVAKRFSPDLYILKIVHNDIRDSLAIEDRAIYLGVRQTRGSFEEVAPQLYRPSRLRRIIGHSAIARYLYINLGLKWKFKRKNQDRQFEANIDIARMDVSEMKGLLKYLFTKYLHEVDG